MNKYKIGISGAHSTGKTSFIKKLADQLKKESKNPIVVNSIASKCPFPILREHTVESALWIAQSNIIKELEAERTSDIIIVDRPIVDCWAYLESSNKTFNKINDAKFKTLRDSIENWLPTYNILFQTVIDADIQIGTNKKRDMNIDYRDRVAREMIKSCSTFNIVPRNLTSSNSDECIKQILEEIL